MVKYLADGPAACNAMFADFEQRPQCSGKSLIKAKLILAAGAAPRRIPTSSFNGDLATDYRKWKGTSPRHGVRGKLENIKFP